MNELRSHPIRYGFAGLLLFCVAAAPWVAQPAMSRGLQILSITPSDCTSRARRAFEMEGYTGLTGISTDWIGATKGIHRAYIMCDQGEGGRTIVNIVVASSADSAMSPAPSA